MRILVIAPHPDDEVLGCGGTIIKHSNQGDEVYLCIVTKTYSPDWPEEFDESRKAEIENVKKILGIKKIFFLDLPAAKLDTIPHKDLNNSLEKCLEGVKPDTVYLPHYGDMHKDHRLVFESAVVALRPKNDVGLETKRILCYETLSETDWAPPIVSNAFTPNLYIDVSQTLEDKIRAMACYKSEIKKFPHPRSPESIRSLALKRGVEAGINAAEAFIIMREIK